MSLLEQQHVTEKLPFYLNGTLEAPVRVRVEAHLAACPSCREELAFWQQLSGLVLEEVQMLERSAPPLSGMEPAFVQAQSERNLPTRGSLPGGLGRLARRIWTFLAGQLTVLRRRILLASLAILAAGLLALVPSDLPGGAMILFRALAPLASAAGIALVYSDPEHGASELLDTMPTSPRLVLLARLAIVFSTNAVLMWLLVLVLGRQGIPLSALLGQWLGPMAFLSSFALLVAVLSDATTGASLAGGLWVLFGTGQRVTTSLGSQVLAQAAVALRQPGVAWGLAAINVFLTLWLVGIPRPARHRTLSNL